MSFRQWVVVEKLFPTERLRRRPQRKRLLAKPKDPMSMPLWKSIQLVIQIKTKTTSAVLAAATTWSCPGIRTERSFYLTALAKFVTLTTVVDTVYQKMSKYAKKSDTQLMSRFQIRRNRNVFAVKATPAVVLASCTDMIGASNNLPSPWRKGHFSETIKATETWEYCSSLLSIVGNSVFSTQLHWKRDVFALDHGTLSHFALARTVFIRAHDQWASAKR